MLVQPVLVDADLGVVILPGPVGADRQIVRLQTFKLRTETSRVLREDLPHTSKSTNDRVTLFEAKARVLALVALHEGVSVQGHCHVAKLGALAEEIHMADMGNVERAGGVYVHSSG